MADRFTFRKFPPPAPVEEPELRIEIKNKLPVELLDLTASFTAMAAEFQTYVTANEPESAAADVRLYVKKLETGSIIAQLVAVSPQIVALAATAHAVVGFSKDLKATFDFLLGVTAERPASLDKASLTNISSIVEPIAKDGAAQINIGTIHNYFESSISSTAANAIQNRASRLIAEDETQSSRYHENVLLYWYQTRNDPTSKRGDRAIVESISNTPVKTIFVNDRDKAAMIEADENLFHRAYVVDLFVDTVKRRIALYQVVRVHDAVDLPG